MLRQIIALLVAFVVLWMVADKGGPQGVRTGVVAALHPGEWISVANNGIDPNAFPIALRETTTYEAGEDGAPFDPAAIRTGLRVTVWYRSVAERRLVADKVRVLPHGTMR
jgi:hypothetical protein